MHCCQKAVQACWHACVMAGWVCKKGSVRFVSASAGALQSNCRPVRLVSGLSDGVLGGVGCFLRMFRVINRIPVSPLPLWFYVVVCTASPRVALHRGDWSVQKMRAGLVGVEGGCTHQMLTD